MTQITAPGRKIRRGLTKERAVSAQWLCDCAITGINGFWPGQAAADTRSVCPLFSCVAGSCSPESVSEINKSKFPVNNQFMLGFSAAPSRLRYLSHNQLNVAAPALSTALFDIQNARL